MTKGVQLAQFACRIPGEGVRGSVPTVPVGLPLKFFPQPERLKCSYTAVSVRRDPKAPIMLICG